MKERSALRSECIAQALAGACALALSACDPASAGTSRFGTSGSSASGIRDGDGGDAAGAGVVSPGGTLSPDGGASGGSAFPNSPVGAGHITDGQAMGLADQFAGAGRGSASAP